MPGQGKRYREASGHVTQGERYSLDDALQLVKKSATAKFDESVDIAVRLGVNPRQADQMIRGAISLPFGIGKTVRVVVFAEGDAARAAEEAGADAVSLVNTFLAMAIDVETRRPKLSNVMGGLSGPAIRPIAVRMVHECRQRTRLPIVGIGGIASAGDALEFIIAGASAVQVGTANFVDPFIWGKLTAGLDAYMTRHGVARVADLVGSLDTSPQART